MLKKQECIKTPPKLFVLLNSSDIKLLREIPIENIQTLSVFAFPRRGQHCAGGWGHNPHAVTGTAAMMPLVWGLREPLTTRLQSHGGRGNRGRGGGIVRAACHATAAPATTLRA